MIARNRDVRTNAVVAPWFDGHREVARRLNASTQAAMLMRTVPTLQGATFLLARSPSRAPIAGIT
jgi:hypothetical protein